MESPKVRPEIEWFDTPLPRASLWVDSAITIAVIVIYAIILIVTGFSRGNIVLPSAFAAFFGIVLALVWYGPLRRSPARIGFSEQGIHFKLRRKDYHIDWRMVEELEFAFPKFPSLPLTYSRSELETDGKFIALQPGEESEICHQHFTGQAQLVKHHEEAHPEFFRDRGSSTGLDALFGDL